LRKTQKERSIMSQKGILFYIKSYKFNSAFIKNFFFVIILFMMPFLTFGFLFYENTQNMMDSEIKLENAAFVKSIREISDMVLKQADYITAYVTNLNNVEMFMINDWFNNIEGGDSANLRDIVTTAPLIYDIIDSIYIYSEINDTVVTPTGVAAMANHQDNGWYPVYLETASPNTVIFPRVKNRIFPRYITIMRPVFVNGAKKGAIIANINTNKLMELFSTDKYGSKLNVFLIGANGEIISSSDSAFFGQFIKNIPLFEGFSPDETYIGKDGQYIISSEISEYYGITYISFNSVSVYKNKMDYMTTLTWLLILAIVIISIVAAFIIAVNSFRPMREIISILEKPDEFYSTAINRPQGNLNELKYIINRILETTHRTAEMESELAGRLVQLDKSHFAMLQAQINPHFLYNTLETINWMASDFLNNYENPVSRALSNLGELFRANANSSEYFIKLKDEISQTNLYIDILKLRYDDMFTVDWNIEEGLKEKSIIKLTLQPFIENAVYHGLKPAGGGKIKVSAVSDKGRVVITVEDNGAGMSRERLEEFIKTLNLDFKDSDAHIGAYNVCRRYKIVFGVQCETAVRSTEGSGTSVTLKFPYIDL
jgi:two-component system sensor histidine kinase YesM